MLLNGVRLGSRRLLQSIYSIHPTHGWLEIPRPRPNLKASFLDPIQFLYSREIEPHWGAFRKKHDLYKYIQGVGDLEMQP